MSINCEVVLHWGATPEQHKALGQALWGWCGRASGWAGTYQYLDNQALADLLAGRPPTGSPRARDGGLPYVPFSVPGDPARDREATLESLRGAIPAGGTADVRVEGVSWRTAEVQRPAPARGPFVAVVPHARE